MVRISLTMALPVVFACSALSQSSSLDLSTQRLWVAKKSEERTRQASLRVSFAPEHFFPAKIDFECEVMAPEPFDETHLVLTILDPRGNPVHTGEIRLNLAKGSAPAKFTWEPPQLSDGAYSAVFELHRQTGGPLAQVVLSLDLLTGVNIQNDITRVRGDAMALRQALDTLAAAGTRPAYPRLHTTIVEDYLPVADGLLAAGDWRRAYQFVSYLDSLAKTARLELSVVTPATASSWVSPTPPASKLEIRDAQFVSESGPVFLFGASYRGNSTQLLSVLERYGLGLTVFRAAPSDTLADAQHTTNFADAMGAFLDEARQRGLQVILDLAPEQLPDWVRLSSADVPDSGSFAYDLMAPEVRSVLARHFNAVLAAAKTHSNVLGVSLANGPALKLRESTMREGLISLAKSRYGEYDKMNARWRTRYLGFDEIKVDWSSRHSAYLHDLQAYHQELGTQFFSWLSGLSREAAPNLPVLVQFADTAFEKGESAHGIDRESILSTMEIAGCSTAQELGGEKLAMGKPQQAACYTLLRSLRPSAPVLNTNDRFALPDGVFGESAYDRLRTMMWEAVLAGLGASAMEMGRPGEGSTGVLSRPELIDAYATAHLDINRLAPIVAALQQAPAPVRILWSTSSKMYNQGDPYVASAMRAYEGCSNFGPRTAFISERECERDGLKDVKVLVIPKALALSDGAFRAIDRYIENGGVTIRQGNPFPYDQQGISRTDVVLVSKRTILLRSEDTARAYLDALDAAYDLEGMDSPPRPVNDFGYPIDGVKARFATHERVHYLYLVNMQERPVRVKLAGRYSAGVDLVSGNRVDFPDIIEPLTPMVIQLDEPAVPEKVATNVDIKSVPSAVLKAVVDESTRKATESKPALRHGR